MYSVIAFVSAWLLLLLATGRMYPEAFVWVLGISVTIVLLGLFHRTVEQFIRALMQPLMQFDGLRDFVQTGVSRTQGYISELRREKKVSEEGVLHSRLAGFLLHAVLTVGLLLAELYLIVEVARVLFPHEAPGSLPLLSALESYMAWIIGGSIVAGSFLWGTYIGDAGGNTNFTPVHDMPSDQREQFLKKAWSVAGMFGLVIVLLAVYRGVSLLPAEGAAMVQEPVALESMNFDLDALEMSGEEVSEALPEPNTMYDHLGEVIMITVQVILAAVIFITLLYSKWLFEWLVTFSAIMLAKTIQLVLWVVHLLVRLISTILRFIAVIAVEPLDFILRVAVLVTAPLASQIDPKYVDHAKEKSTLKEAGDEDRAEMPQDRESTYQNQVEEQLNNDNRQENHEQASGSATDCDRSEGEPVMTITDEPEREQNNRNWSPYQS